MKILITQFFKTPPNIIKKFISESEKSNFSKIYIFTDGRLRINNNKFIIIPRKTKLKWKDLFSFIKNNPIINNKQCVILDPEKMNLNADFYNSTDQIKIYDNYVITNNIKEIPNVNRFIFCDYNFLELNIGYKNKYKVASICHIFYEDLIDDMINKLKVLKDFNVDYYFTLPKNLEKYKGKLKKEFNSVVIITENKGLDIGPFLKILKIIQKSSKKYDYIIKTHTKKSLVTSGEYFGNIWRNDLLEILNKDKIKDIIEYMNKDIDMIGSKKWIIDYRRDNMNIKNVSDILNKMNVNKNKHFNKFIGGAMFWINYKLINKYFTEDIIDYYYDLMEEGYFYQKSKNDPEYITHSFERIFGLLCRTIKGI